MSQEAQSVAQATRAALRYVPTGVAVVTTIRDGEARGMTLNSFASVSLEPPTLLICVNREARSYLYITHSLRFCLNILKADQREIAERFSGKRRERQFDDIAHERGIGDVPLLAGALAHLECSVSEEHHIGSHSIVVGSIERVSHQTGEPLGYFDGGFRVFSLGSAS